ncbi:MAG TPA: hypothetical protein VGT61_00510 [Thermomicrobiales bacterium]|jgi:hypothetical protein|nr:hypothetical protein [Thermomicrobiales bacterium]
MTRMRSMITVATVLALLIGGYGLLQATAHEQRDVADEYSFVVGFLEEPAYAGEQNGLDLRISTLDPTGGVNSEPVEGAEETLTATVSFGELSMPLEISPVWNTPGSYRAIFFPTTPGDYSFHITGTLGDTEIDETFTSADGEFSSVQDPTPLMFPPLSGTPVAGTPAAATPAA